MKIKYVIFLVGVFALLLGIWVYINNNQDYKIKINNQLVFQDEVDLYVNLIKSEMEETANVKTSEEIAKFWIQNIEGVNTIDIANQKAIDNLIKNKVTTQNAKKLKINSTNEEQLKKVEQLKELWKERNMPLVSDSVLELFANDLIISNKLFNYIAKDITLVDEDFINMYNIYNGKQILLDLKNKNLADEIFSKINAGYNFDNFISYSIDNETKNNGGKFTFYNSEFLNNDYEKAILQMEVGKVIKISTEQGIYIIKLESIEKPDEDILMELKLKYSDYVLNKKRSNEYDKQVKEWVDEAKIEYK